MTAAAVCFYLGETHHDMDLFLWHKMHKAPGNVALEIVSQTVASALGRKKGVVLLL